MRPLFATVAGGLEELLKTELIKLGATDCQIKLGGVQFAADDRVLYTTLLWSRLAARILFPIAEFAIDNEHELYEHSYAIPWPTIFTPNSTFAVYFQGANAAIRNSQFGALRIKDGIVDRFQADQNFRPDVDKYHPDSRIVARLRKGRLALYLDLSGSGLHQRQYRLAAGTAPLKETLTAAVVSRSGWQVDTPLIDPFCGSGTLLIEAALQAANIAPGLHRQHYGFYHWQGYNAQCWQQVLKAAKTQRDQVYLPAEPLFFGFDKDREAIRNARENAKHAGVAKWLQFEQQDISQLYNPTPDKIGTILTNPPYGARLESEAALIAVYSQLGERVKQYFGGWQLSVLSAAPSLFNYLPLRAVKQFTIKNGDLDAIQKNYRINSQQSATSHNKIAESAPFFANRLKKNAQKIIPWALKEGLEAYRLYDADLPEYNVAIDCYGDQVVIQEYSAPKTIDAQKARTRLLNLINVTLATLELTADKIVIKKRLKQTGRQQYQPLSQKKDFLLVKEYDAQFWVNLTDYLDSGLFLDHRLVRKKLATLARGKRFLNLFAYTGTASVYAALGGARSTITVDMSRTYLDWARRNFNQNGLWSAQHHLIQADVLRFLEECEDKFDLIFIDPPTFSNSKKMAVTLDIQRDHVILLKKAKRLLSAQGTIVFSTNKRGFKIDRMALEALGLYGKDITASTIPLDFQRNRHIHYCYVFTV